MISPSSPTHRVYVDKIYHDIHPNGVCGIRETSGIMDSAKPKDSHLLKVHVDGGVHLWYSRVQ